jgi:acyl-coenzyme A synthetase/AMP-(fatty) acid ligase
MYFYIEMHHTCILPNVVHAFTTFYALNKIGVIANIVHPLTSPEVLKESIDMTKSKAIFILDILAGRVGLEYPPKSGCDLHLTKFCIIEKSIIQRDTDVLERSVSILRISQFYRYRA